MMGGDMYSNGYPSPLNLFMLVKAVVQEDHKKITE